MKVNLIFVLLIGLFLFPISSNGQERSDYADFFRLKNGFAFIGKILSFDDKTIEIELKDGRKITLPFSEFKTIKQSQDFEKDEKQKIYSSKPYNKWNFDIGIGFGFGGASDLFLSGTSLQGAVLYKALPTNNHHFLTFNTGIEYLTAYRYTFNIPFALGYRFLLLPDHKTVPFFFSNYGTSLAMDTEEDIRNPWEGRDMRMRGGPRLETGLGFHYRTSLKTAWYVSGSYLLQDLYFEDSHRWGWYKVDQRLKRIFIKCGVMF